MHKTPHFANDNWFQNFIKQVCLIFFIIFINYKLIIIWYQYKIPHKFIIPSLKFTIMSTVKNKIKNYPINRIPNDINNLKLKNNKFDNNM